MSPRLEPVHLGGGRYADIPQDAINDYQRRAHEVVTEALSDPLIAAALDHGVNPYEIEKRIFEEFVRIRQQRDGELFRQVMGMLAEADEQLQTSVYYGLTGHWRR